MRSYLIRRALWGILTLFLFLAGMFVFVHLVHRGDFVSKYVFALSPEQMAALRERLGLDQPLLQQFGLWLGGVLRGDLGVGFNGQPVLETILSRMPYSLLIFIPGLAISSWIGFEIGKAVSWDKPGWLTRWTTFVMVSANVSFPAWTAFLVSFVLLGLIGFRAYGEYSVPWVLWERFEADFGVGYHTTIVLMTKTLLGTILIVVLLALAMRFVFRRRPPAWWTFVAAGLIWGVWWVAAGSGMPALLAFRGLLLPLTTFILLSTGEMVLLTQAAMVETTHEAYITAARAKGLSEKQVLDRHAARNALLPLVSKFVISLPYLLVGMVIIEQAVFWPGMGSHLLSVTDTQDLPMMLGYLFLIGLFLLLVRLGLETIYGLLDPRLRISAAVTTHHRPGFWGARGATRTISNVFRPTVAGWAAWLNNFSLRALARWRDHQVQRLRLTWHSLRENGVLVWEHRLARLGMLLLAFFLALALIHPLLRATVMASPIYDPLHGYDMQAILENPGPSLKHPLGVDLFGRDVLSHFLASIRATFTVALTAALVSGFVSVFLAGMAVVYQGWFDTLTLNLSNALLLLPVPLFMIVLGARYAFLNELQFGLVYGLFAGAGGALILLRAQGLKIVRLPFIDAARVAGGGRLHLVRKHIIPHLIPIAIANTMLTIAGAVIADAFVTGYGARQSRLALTFVAQYVPGMTPDWRFWLWSVPRALTITFFAASFYFVSLGLRRVIDPRMRES